MRSWSFGRALMNSTTLFEMFAMMMQNVGMDEVGFW
jgi:hypothetical protein